MLCYLLFIKKIKCYKLQQVKQKTTGGNQEWFLYNLAVRQELRLFHPGLYTLLQAGKGRYLQDGARQKCGRAPPLSRVLVGNNTSMRDMHYELHSQGHFRSLCTGIFDCKVFYDQPHDQEYPSHAYSKCVLQVEWYYLIVLHKINRHSPIAL